ncbi:Large proline-rich protein bag6 [Homalodisca vitripennis]|nr:Large proline-rich protein bag6 [Homalodisca vitripennis]
MFEILRTLLQCALAGLVLVELQYTVRQFKEHIADSVSISADSQRLIYCGRVLQDDKSLTEYDVNGKVIHLVQRAPPVNNGSGPDRGSTSARTNSSPPGARRGTSLLHRGTFIGSTGNTGNAMYLGAMAFPAEIMEAHGISMQNPRHCLSQSRLAVVRSMLRRASIILNRLENPPQESADTSPENGTCPPETSAEEETAAGATTPIAAIEISPQLIINGQQIDVGGPSIDIQAEAVPEQTTSASGGNGDPQTASTSEEQPPQNETEEEGGNAGSRYPRTRGLADLMDQASEINTRVQPFMAQYQQLMRDDPVFSDQEAVVTNQRLFTSVSEIMHNLAHAYHALSDIMCDLAQPPPRFLRCRPVLIHHSAVVQTGFPIQVSDACKAVFISN